MVKAVWAKAFFLFAHCSAAVEQYVLRLPYNVYGGRHTTCTTAVVTSALAYKRFGVTLLLCLGFDVMGKGESYTHPNN